MRIERDQIIAGFPAKVVRDVMKSISPMNRMGTLSSISYRLNCSKKRGKEFIKEMIKEGYLIEISDHPYYKTGHYNTTMKGNTLAQASARPPIKRATAEKKLKELLKRVVEVNYSDYAYKVKRLAVFGSFLSNNETINDIDIAIELIPAFKERKAQREARERSKKRSLWKSNLLQDMVAWPRIEVYQKLKQRSPVYSLHEYEEIGDFKEDDKNFKYIDIYKLKN